VQRAEARTRLYGAHGGGVDQRLSLVSGIAGVVVERNLTPGQELRPDQMGAGVPPLFVVSDPGSLWVMIDARESEAGTLRPGAAFELIVPSLPGEKFEGRVFAAADSIDPATRTIKVRGVIANPDRKLKAEMLATARVERTPGAGVVVPASAVLLREARQSVFVQVRPGVFEPRDIVIGWQGPKEVLVSRGLEAGEQVVSDNTLLLARQYALLRSASPRGEDSGAPPQAAASASVARSAAAR
jgi:cobalt-zinc-cadmium efflux system membrane fusion protein